MTSIIPQKKLKRNSGGTFAKMGLIPPLLRGIQAMGYRLPTPIQRKCIPIILDGHDVVAMARTGSGKSAAFIIPLIANLREHSAKVGCRGLILSPTRDLALQTAKFAKSISKYTDLRICVVIGGESVEQQFDALSYNPDIIIATPGRISYLLKEIGIFNLRSTKYVIFDEADRLFEMGFAIQIKQIMNSLSTINMNKRQTMLFSATMPSTMVQFTRASLINPVVIRLDTDTKISPHLQLSYLYCRQDDKLAVLLCLLRQLLENDALMLIFAGTRYHVELISKFLSYNDMESVSCFGSMEQEYRNRNILRFRRKQVHIMIVTDVASRGLDIPLLDFVINFQIPTTPKSFVHRVGRVARNGKAGVALSIVQYSELPYVADIYRFLGHNIHEDNSNGQIDICIHNDNDNMDVLDEEDMDDDDAHIEVKRDTNGMIVIEQDEEEEEEEEEDALFKIVRDDPSTNNNNKKESLVIFGSDKVSFGSVPDFCLFPFVEIVNDAFDKNDELNKLRETCDKAMDIYNRTKAKATRYGLYDAKRINYRRIHPMFAHKIGKKELKTFKMLDEIATFKPHGTVFEIGGAANPSYKVMIQQRNRFDSRVYGIDKKLSIKMKKSAKQNKAQQYKRTKKEEYVKKYRDNEYFIDGENSETKHNQFVNDMLMVTNNGQDDLKQFIMELDEDERSAINIKKKLYRYNANTGKYVTEYLGDRVNRFMREKNESAKTIHKTNHKYGKLYEEWKKKSKREIGINGSYEKTENTQNRSDVKFMGLRKARHIKGSNEYYEKQRAKKRIMDIRNHKVAKEKFKTDKIKKFKREKFRKWWSNNKERVKTRKGKRRMRGY